MKDEESRNQLDDLEKINIEENKQKAEDQDINGIPITNLAYRNPIKDLRLVNHNKNMNDMGNPINAVNFTDAIFGNRNFSFMNKLEGIGRDSNLIIQKEDLAQMIEDMS